MGGAKSTFVMVAAAAGDGPLVQAVAAAAEIALVDGVAATKVKLLPIGEIAMRDGRGPFRVRDRAHAEQVVAATQAFLGSADFSFDYDHQMLHAVKPGVGGRAIASGWAKGSDLSVEADGIYANNVAWTPAAAAQLAAREYRYISPLFMAAKDGGDVIHLKNAALVNIGAIDLPAIAAGASGEEDDMIPAAILAALGLAAGASETEVAAAITDLKAKPSTSTIAIAAGLTDGATVEEIAAAVTAIKKPDMSGYVPLAVVEPMREQLKVLNGDRLGKQVDELIAAGIVIPAKRESTLDWFQKDEVAAAAFFKDMPAVIKPGAELGDRKPTEKVTTLSADEVAACAATGMSHEDFLKAKNEEIA